MEYSFVFAQVFTEGINYLKRPYNPLIVYSLELYDWVSYSKYPVRGRKLKL